MFRVRPKSMIAKDFGQWLSLIPQLSKRQIRQCLEQLNDRSGEEGNCEMPEVIRIAECERCPHCEHDRLHKSGFASGLQRWRCTKCSKSFNALTGTPLARLRKKEKWLDNAEAMIAGLTIRQTAKKCDVHRNTSFRWRHRFLMFHKSAQCADLTGIAESDATYFRKSEKGSRTLKRKPRKRGKSDIKGGRNTELVAVITLRDRSNHGADRLAEGKQELAATQLYQTHLRADTLLITDGDHELCAAAKSRDPDAHLALPGLEGRGIKGCPFHLQTNNAFHSSLKTWMSRFKGVATKYLANYVGWNRHRAEDTHRGNSEIFIALSFSPLAVNPNVS